MSGNTAAAVAGAVGEPVGRRVPVGSAPYNGIVEFLYEEAWLLDQIDLTAWAAMLATDLVYTVPLRHTMPLAQQAASVVRSTAHYHEDYRSIGMRVARLTRTKSAWAEDPPSRTRRLVTNIRVTETGRPDDFAVSSYLLMTRSRCESPDFHLLSGERRDVIRKTGDGFKLARREVILDQSVLGMPNLAVFL